MNDIINKTYELIDELDNSDIIKNIDYYKSRVLSNEELVNLINRGKDTQDKYLLMDIKHKLYKNSDYKNYIDNYNELFYIVIDINNRLKKLLNDKICYK